MANRSDTFTATLPRYMKRMLELTKGLDEHERGELKRSMISAHKSYVAFKLKRNNADNNTSSDGGSE